MLRTGNFLSEVSTQALSDGELLGADPVIIAEDHRLIKTFLLALLNHYTYSIVKYIIHQIIITFLALDQES